MQLHGKELNVKSYKGERECSSHTTTSIHIMITELHAYTAKLHLRVNTHVGTGAEQQRVRSMSASQYAPIQLVLMSGKTMSQ